jgi:hypothetical protein
MSKTWVFSMFLVLLFSCQNNEKPVIRAATTSLGSPPPLPAMVQPANDTTELLPFIPNGYSILQFAKGDANLDSIEDVVLVLKHKGEDTLINYGDSLLERPLLILTRSASHSLHLAARNDKAVDCVNCGALMGDGFQYVAIEDGSLLIDNEGGSTSRWVETIEFKYYPKEKTWFLESEDHRWYNLAGPTGNKHETVKDFGKVKFEDYGSE